MTGRNTSAASSKRSREEGSSREANAFTLICDECDDSQLAYLLAQQQAFVVQAEAERHDNTNNPGKGKGNVNVKFRLLNLVLVGELDFPESVRRRFQFDQSAHANAANSKSSRSKSLWDAVSKLSSRVETVAKCFEKGICCTGASSADDLTPDQWISIRERNTNKNDKQKWKVSQSLIDASKEQGFDSAAKSELKPMSNATSVLNSFASRNTAEKHDEEPQEVQSPDKPTQPAFKVRREQTLRSLSADTADDITEQDASEKATASTSQFALKDATLRLTTDNEDNIPLLQPEGELTIEMEKDKQAGQQANLLKDMTTTELDYSYLPSPKEQPPTMDAVQKPEISKQKEAAKQKRSPIITPVDVEMKDPVKESTTFKARKKQSPAGGTAEVAPVDPQLLTALNRIATSQEVAQGTMQALGTGFNTIVTQLGALITAQGMAQMPPVAPAVANSGQVPAQVTPTLVKDTAPSTSTGAVEPASTGIVMDDAYDKE